jgi:hypothetical protein
MGMVERRLIGVTLACGTLGVVGMAAPAIAAATPTITVAEPCVIDTNPFMSPTITVTGSGWTAGDDINLSGGDDLDGDATVGADGTFTTTVEGDDINDGNPGMEDVTLTATDEGPTSSGTATTSFAIANLAVSVAPAEAAFTKHVTFSFSGFSEGKAIYAHYLHKGTVVARQKFGTATGVCGLLKKKKALQYPGGHPKYDKYTVQFDDSAGYSKNSTPRILFTLTRTVI